MNTTDYVWAVALAFNAVSAVLLIWQAPDAFVRRLIGFSFLFLTIAVVLLRGGWWA